MYPPGQSITIQDGGLNLPVEALSRPLVFGVCSGGTANTLYWLNKSGDATALGRGPAIEMAAPIADSGGCLFMKTASTTAGSCAAVTVARVSTSTGTITVANLPNDSYRVRIRITTSGTVNVGRFQYALDGNTTVDAEGWSPIYTIPSGGTFALPGTGLTDALPLTLTFTPGAGPIYFEIGDQHRFDCIAPHYTTADLTAAFAVLLTQMGSLRPERILFAGVNQTASAAIVLAAAIAGHLDTLVALKRFPVCVMDGGSIDSIGNFRTAIATFTDDRVGLVYDPITATTGPMVVTKIPFTGYTAPVVPAVNIVAERYARTELSESCARVRSGSCRGVIRIGNDEGTNPLFTAEDRIITMRRVDGYGGFFITKPFIRSAPTSDFRTLQWMTVISKACQIAHDSLQQWIESNLRALTDGTGYLAEEDAMRVQDSVNCALREQLKEPTNIEGFKGHVSDCKYTVTRTNNYLTTGAIYGILAIVPLREVEGLYTTVGLVSSLEA